MAARQLESRWLQAKRPRQAVAFMAKPFDRNHFAGEKEVKFPRQ